MKKILNLLASELAKLEGGKSQITIGDMRQALALIKKCSKKDPVFVNNLLSYLVGK
jgi:hypothetical protein